MGASLTAAASMTSPGATKASSIRRPARRRPWFDANAAALAPEAASSTPPMACANPRDLLIYVLLRPLLLSPNFKGKAKLTSWLREFQGSVVCDVAHGLRMELDLSEHLQADLFANKTLEPRTVELFLRLLKPGDTCIDV